MHLPLLCEVYVASARPDLVDSAGLQTVETWHLLPDKASVSLQPQSSFQALRQSLILLSKLWLKSAGYLADRAPSPSLAASGRATKHHEWRSPAALSIADKRQHWTGRGSAPLPCSQSLYIILYSSSTRGAVCCQWRNTLVYRAMLDQHCYLLGMRQLKITRSI